MGGLGGRTEKGGRIAGTCPEDRRDGCRIAGDGESPGLCATGSRGPASRGGTLCDGREAGSRTPGGPEAGSRLSGLGGRVRGSPPAPRGRRPKGAGARRKAGGVGRRTSENRRERRRVRGSPPAPSSAPSAHKGGRSPPTAGGVGRRTSDSRREPVRVAGAVRGRDGRTAQTVVEIRQICAGAGNGWLCRENRPQDRLGIVGGWWGGCRVG
jgi:hypothetical protein